ncbi:hypothetical protein HU200_016818 [Digitaria exilis]|uniref:DUF1618 domain-containing protein n=1 Tax=Digitaria exilis TaxID=1010633 RepID=A0A835KI68_9POAL|nr:hypothetical protein HU200_016818 [Digitaria exilis]
MIIADMQSESEGKDAVPPRLQYVPLPVDMDSGDPDHSEYGRGYPQGSRCVCGTSHGIKFVSVDRRHTSNWGVCHREMLRWNHTFRITTWLLRKDDYTWRRDATMYEQELWDTLDYSGDHYLFPRVVPEHPIVNMDNPDIVCFRLRKTHYSFDSPIWMIEVDMKKKVLLSATDYTLEASSLRKERMRPSHHASYALGDTRATMGGTKDRDLVRIEAHLFRCGSDEWKVFKKLQVNGANGGGDLPPRLWYVPFPVDRVKEIPGHYDRGFPQDSRCVCATHDGIKFLKKNRYNFEEPAWMIEADMKKKALQAWTGSIKTAIRASQGFSVVSSEIPRYLYGGGEACKKRRQ